MIVGPVQAVRSDLAVDRLYRTVDRYPEVGQAMEFYTPESGLKHLRLEVAEVGEALFAAGHGSKRKTVEELGDVILTAVVMVKNLGGQWATTLRGSADKVARRVQKADGHMSRPWPGPWVKAKQEVG